MFHHDETPGSPHYKPEGTPGFIQLWELPDELLDNSAIWCMNPYNFDWSSLPGHNSVEPPQDQIDSFVEFMQRFHPARCEEFGIDKPSSVSREAD